MQEPTQLYGIKNIDIVNTIGEMKSFTKNNFNLCTDEFLTILKNICDRKVILTDINLEVYVACWYKTTFRQFFLSTNDLIIG